VIRQLVHVTVELREQYVLALAVAQSVEHGFSGRAMQLCVDGASAQPSNQGVAVHLHNLQCVVHRNQTVSIRFHLATQVRVLMFSIVIMCVLGCLMLESNMQGPAVRSGVM
jgi:hypothetical protein